MRKKNFILSLVVILVLQFGCAKKVLISYNQLEKDNLVQIQTKSKISYNGIVKAKQPNYVVLQTNRNKKSLNKVTKDNIYSILSTPSIYDYQKKVISEWEIQDNQGSKNKVLYTIGGAGLSFGASFFLGSLIHRGISDSEYRNTVLWATTGLGTAAGTYLFLRTGKKKDRDLSITEIRDRRYIIAQKEIVAQKRKREKVRSELEKMKVDRDKQDTEMKNLMKRLKTKDQQVEKGDSD